MQTVEDNTVITGHDVSRISINGWELPDVLSVSLELRNDGRANGMIRADRPREIEKIINILKHQTATVFLVVGESNAAFTHTQQYEFQNVSMSYKESWNADDITTYALHFDTRQWHVNLHPKMKAEHLHRQYKELVRINTDPLVNTTPEALKARLKAGFSNLGVKFLKITFTNDGGFELRGSDVWGQFFIDASGTVHR